MSRRARCIVLSAGGSVFMAPRDLALTLVICLVWAGNQVMSRLVVADLGVPPFFYALVRTIIIVVVLLPLLRPRPAGLARVVTVGVLLGGGGFALNFAGLRVASPSAATVVLQLAVPLATVLSVLLLGERLDRWRLAGITLAFAGVLVLLWDPSVMDMSAGLVFSVGAALCGALGSVLLKTLGPVHPLRVQAWGGLFSVPLLFLCSLAVEQQPVAAALAAGWPFIAAVGASALIVSVFSHSAYYRLLQTYEASRIVPLMLLQVVFTVALGMLVTGDRFTGRMALGSAVTLLGVFLIIRSGARGTA